jgi:hypothetical protein
MVWAHRGASSTTSLLTALVLVGFRGHRDATHSLTAAIGAGTTHPVEVNHRAAMSGLLSFSPESRATRVPTDIAHGDGRLRDESDGWPHPGGENSPVAHQFRR